MPYWVSRRTSHTDQFTLLILTIFLKDAECALRHARRVIVSAATATEDGLCFWQQNSSLSHHTQPGSMFRPKQQSGLFLGALNYLCAKMTTLLSSSFHIHLCSLVLRRKTALSYKCYIDRYNISNGTIMLQQE